MKLYGVLARVACLSVLVAGCQTIANRADVASVEEALGGVAVSLPPRDTFTGMKDVPYSLSDIQSTKDCCEPAWNIDPLAGVFGVQY
jgi:hypothetical protein